MVPASQNLICYFYCHGGVSPFPGIREDLRPVFVTLRRLNSPRITIEERGTTRVRALTWQRSICLAQRRVALQPVKGGEEGIRSIQTGMNGSVFVQKICDPTFRIESHGDFLRFKDFCPIVHSNDLSLQSCKQNQNRSTGFEIITM